jgi:glutamate synthase domain-containing protein 3
MSGGLLYLYDPEGRATTALAAGEFDVDPLEWEDDQWLETLLRRYADETMSSVAERLIKEWSRARMDFVAIQSVEYRRAREAARG